MSDPTYPGIPSGMSELTWSGIRQRMKYDPRYSSYRIDSPIILEISERTGIQIVRPGSTEKISYQGRVTVSNYFPSHDNHYSGVKEQVFGIMFDGILTSAFIAPGTLEELMSKYPIK